MLSQFVKTAKESSLDLADDDEDDEAFAALAVVDDEVVWEDVEDTGETAVADGDNDNSEAANPLDPSVQDSDLAVIQQVAPPFMLTL